MVEPNRGGSMSVYYTDSQITLLHGDAAQELETLADASVDCVLTSPPYWGLRDYDHSQQIGLEPTLSEYIAALTQVFNQVHRVLKDTGTLWLNMGDTYNNRSASGLAQPTLAPKNLLGVPWRLAFALQDSGWVLRNDIIWSKPNAMPESVRDRVSNRHEHLFLFSKQPSGYYFDLAAIKQPRKARPDSMGFGRTRPGITPPRSNMPAHRPQRLGQSATVDVVNPGDVWNIPTTPFPGAHFAAMPTELALRALQAGCPQHGAVLDPFSGTGTTGYAAAQLDHKYIGIDINSEYLKLSLNTRLAQPTLSA